MEATIPKLSDIKQYYALGFYGPVTQTGQHEDGLSLSHFVWGISWEKSMAGAAGIIWRHPHSHSSFWDWLLAGTSSGCWPEHLHRACARVCLWATLWLRLQWGVCTCTRPRPAAATLWGRGSPQNKIRTQDGKAERWRGLEPLNSCGVLYLQLPVQWNKINFLYGFKNWMQYYTLLRGCLECEECFYLLRKWTWTCMDLMCK